MQKIIRHRDKFSDRNIMQKARQLLLAPLAITLGSFAIQSAPAQASTLTFKPTTYNLYNLLDSSLDYGQFFPGVITSYPNNGPQEYLKIEVNPLIDQGTPSETLDAPYGLTKFFGSVYLHDVFIPDPNNPGKYTYQSSTGSTDPNYFPFLKQNYPELPPGYLTLAGSGPNKLFGTELANVTEEVIDGVIHVTNLGTIDIIGGEGLFEGATGKLTYVEHGISGLPYIGNTTIQGTIDIPRDVPEPSTIAGVLLSGVGLASFKVGRRKKELTKKKDELAANS
ncbi:MAG: PEP-CTERM sorting domain-containing protein [Aulosira sp. ZfuVER01]|nr:PEP-CTERM sorting domain-containing protein [Aulosira sp. ZfuVER01]MDZ8001803.1 PEP-CTERM sorting domain-containing protein [Aulosira sp. DedVER01a]MDZ8053278.1 PEP-CTERM sorting domain-containing protein [Aulosira sp. ZfuCHP01]